MILAGVISLTPPPELISWMTVQQLGDEATMSQIDYVPEIAGRRWYPTRDESLPLARYQSYEETPAMTFDADAKVVVLVYPIRDWTAQEIHDWKASTDRFITHTAFRRRFTFAERLAFELAALDNPGGTPAERQAAAEVRVLEKDTAAARHIDLNLPDVQAGLAKLETIGVLAAGRADEIIWGDVEDYEVA